MAKKFEVTPEARRAIDKALARLDATKVRKRKARTAAAIKLRMQRQRERRDAKANRPATYRNLPNALRTRHSLPGWQVLVARMEDGVWYDFNQVKQLMAEFPIGSVKAWLHQKAARAGVIERAGNPDWKPAVYGEIGNQPRYLYGIAPRAAQTVQEWRLALGMTNGAGKHEKAP